MSDTLKIGIVGDIRFCGANDRDFQLFRELAPPELAVSEITDAMRSEQIRRAANSILTTRRLEAFRYYVEQDWSYNRISIQMGITETRARALVQRAVQKINIHLEEDAA